MIKTAQKRAESIAGLNHHEVSLVSKGEKGKQNQVLTGT